MEKYDVYGIGNALVDIIIEVDEDFFVKNNIEKGVMTLVDEERQKHLMQSMHVKQSKIMAGGSAANTMIGISQLGGKSAYSFLTARDELGKVFIEDMKRNGVHTSLQHEDCPSGHSGRCLVMVGPDAERTMNTFLGVSSFLSADHVDEKIINKSTYVYLEGYLVTTAEGVGALLKTKEIATRNHVRTALTLSDPNMVKFFSHHFDKVIGEGVDLLFCNEQEALMYTKTDQLQKACRQLQQISKSFVVTRGEKGALIYDGNELLEIESCKVERVLDTNGAGDIFAGGFLYGLTQGYSYVKSGQIASILAAQVVSQFGPRLETKQVKNTFHGAGCAMERSKEE